MFQNLRYMVPYCKYLRHAYMTASYSRLIDTLFSYVDGVTYASAALHCMRFPSNRPKYSKKNKGTEMSLIYVEWKDTCTMTHQNAPSTPATGKYFAGTCTIYEQSRHPQNDLSAYHVWKLDMNILAFLSRSSVQCPNWGII